MRVTVKYLHPHPKTGMIQYRRRVPAGMREAFGGAREFIRSTGTKDPTEAMKRAKPIHEEFTRQIKDAHTPVDSLSDAQLYRQTIEWMTNNGYTPGKPRTEEESAVRDLHANQILATHEREMKREPDPEDLPREDLFKVEALVGELKAPPLSITDALKVYLAEAGSGRRNGAEQRRFLLERTRIVNMLIKVIGNKAVVDVSRMDARTYRDHLAEQLKSIASVNKYTRICRAIFAAAIREMELNKVNPFDNIQMEDPVAARDKRDSFTDEELNQIVTASREEKLRGDIRNILHILTDTGARIGEISGLEKADLILEHSVPHILIRPNSIRLLKNNSSKRQVPLIGLALEAARHAIAESKHSTALFPAYAGQRGNTAASASLNKFIRTRAKIDDEKLTAHSLRHTFKDRMRNASIPEDVRDYLQGHANGKVSADYGEGASLTYLLSELSKVSPVC